MTLLLLLSGGGTAVPAPAPTPTPTIASYPFALGWEFYLTHYGRDGNIKTAYIMPLWARYTNSLYGDEPLVFALNADSELVDDFEEFDIIVLYLRNIDLGIRSVDGGFVRDFVGIVRNWEYQTDDDGITSFILTAPNEKHILSWRSVMYYSGVANRSTFSSIPAETIMKTLVSYNCTALATTGNGRHRNGNLATTMSYNITVATDQGRGDSISLSMMGERVLDVLRKVATIGGGDFSFSWQGANNWLFEFHPGQLGEDKTSGADRVLFSLDNQTMKRPRLFDKGAVASVAVVGGQNVGTNRAITVTTSPDYIAGENDLEVFVDARNETTAGGRTARGDQQLYERRAQQNLEFEVIQTGDIFYSPVDVTGRRTYWVGDLIQAQYFVETFTRKVEFVSVAFKVPQREDMVEIDVGLIEP